MKGMPCLVVWNITSQNVSHLAHRNPEKLSKKNNKQNPNNQHKNAHEEHAYNQPLHPRPPLSPTTNTHTHTRTHHYACEHTIYALTTSHTRKHTPLHNHYPARISSTVHHNRPSLWLCAARHQHGPTMSIPNPPRCSWPEWLTKHGTVMKHGSNICDKTKVPKRRTLRQSSLGAESCNQSLARCHHSLGMG